jgi:hypothetical protein
VTPLLLTASFAAAGAGFGLLALAMERHRKQLLPKRPPWAPGQRGLMRLAGVLLLGGSFFGCVGVWGASIGATAWFGLLSLMAVAWVAVLAVFAVRRR